MTSNRLKKRHSHGKQLRKKVKTETETRRLYKSFKNGIPDSNERSNYYLKKKIALDFSVLKPLCDGDCQKFAKNAINNGDNVILYCDLCLSVFMLFLLQKQEA